MASDKIHDRVLVTMPPLMIYLLRFFTPNLARCSKFFHEVLALIIAKLLHPCTKRRLSVSSVECYHFPIAHSLLVKVTPIYDCLIQISIEQKCKGALYVLALIIERYKYLCVKTIQLADQCNFAVVTVSVTMHKLFLSKRSVFRMASNRLEYIT